MRNRLGGFLHRASRIDLRAAETRIQQLNIPYATVVQEKTGIPQLALAGVALVLINILILISFNIRFLGVFITNTLGVAYPIYKSLHALETETKVDDTQWLTYWTVYGAFFVFEQFVFSPAVYITNMGRSYFILKVLLLAWCQLLGGALVIYELCLDPLLTYSSKLKASIDKTLMADKVYREEVSKLKKD